MTLLFLVCLTEPAHIAHASNETSWTEISGPVALDQAVALSIQAFGVWWIATSQVTPDLVYLVGHAGLYQSRTAGLTWDTLPHPTPMWRPTGDVPKYDAIAVGSMDRIYVGSGFLDIVTATVDGGLSWIETSAPSGISRWIAAAPTRGELAYALFQSGSSTHGTSNLARTVDGGETWQRFLWAALMVPMAVDPEQPETFYGADHVGDQIGPNHLMLATLPEAASQTEAVRYRNLTSFPAGMQALAFSRDWSHMWVSTTDGMLLVSRDRGQSFELVTDVPIGSYLSSLAADPFNSSIVYGVTHTGHIWVYREPDGRLDQQDAVEGRAQCSRSMPWLQIPAIASAC